MIERRLSIRTYAPSIPITQVGMDVHTGELWRCPVVAIQETIWADEEYEDELVPGWAGLQFITSDRSGEMEADPTYEDWCVGFEFNNKEEDWTEVVKENLARIAKRKERELAKAQKKELDKPKGEVCG